MKKSFYVVFAILSFYTAERLCRLATDGFSVSKLAPASKELLIELEPKESLCKFPKKFFKGEQEQAYKNEPSFCAQTDPQVQISSILAQQRFSYLNKGGQCYAFISEDGQYVLKFFRKTKDLKKTHQSVQLAYDHLARETGLVYLHLAQTARPLPPLQIVDKLQIAHTIPANSCGWFLQRRANLVRPHLDLLMKQGKIEEAKQAISALFELLKQIKAQGIADGDPNLIKNFGFIGKQPIVIDVGRFETTERGRKKLEHSKEDLLHWLNTHYPILSPVLEKESQCLFTTS